MPVVFPPHIMIMALSKVQRLYDACDVVFSSPGAAPTLGEIRWLQNILGQFTTSVVMAFISSFCVLLVFAGR
jgi:cysteamine dioxygenase